MKNLPKLPEGIAHFHTYSWVGISIGASHYMGEIKFKDESFDVKRKLSRIAAIRFNESINKSETDITAYRAGHITNRFESEELLKQHAKKHWREIVPDAKVLLLGDTGYIEPQPVFDGLDNDWTRLLASIRNLYVAYEGKGRYNASDAVYVIWVELLTKAMVGDDKPVESFRDVVNNMITEK